MTWIIPRGETGSHWWGDLRGPPGYPDCERLQTRVMLVYVCCSYTLSLPTPSFRFSHCLVWHRRSGFFCLSCLRSLFQTCLRKWRDYFILVERRGVIFVLRLFHGLVGSEAWAVIAGASTHHLLMGRSSPSKTPRLGTNNTLGYLLWREERSWRQSTAVLFCWIKWKFLLYSSPRYRIAHDIVLQDFPLPTLDYQT